MQPTTTQPQAYQVGPSPATAYQVGPSPAAPPQTGTTQPTAYPVGPSPATAYQVGPSPAAASQTLPTPTAVQQTGSGQTGNALNPTPFLNRTSILKICQIGFSLLTTVCTMVDYWNRAAGFINFVGISALMVAILYLVIHSVQQLHNLFGELTFLWELIQYCVWSIFYLTAAIMAMVNAYDALIGTAIFATGGTVAFSIDAYYQIQEWRFRRTANAQHTDQTQPLAMNPIQPGINVGLRLPSPRYNLLLF